MSQEIRVLKDTGSDPHDSSRTHVSGKSEFIDDRPVLPGELEVGTLFSPYGAATIDRLDIRGALKVPGVVCILTAKDVHHNAWGTIFQDQPLIASSQVQFAGEVVAVVGATSSSALRAGLRAIVVKWRQTKAIMSIREAITAKSFIGGERTIARGDAEKGLSHAPHRLQGTLIIKGADHFYLESQAAVVYPKERGYLEVHASTQHPTETQHVVAEACGLPFSHVTCLVKRLGGGFGGKESQAAPFAAYAALVAQKTGCPARIALSKDDDMMMTGKRNPFEIDYDVGFDEAGMIVALEAKLYSDGGAYADLSTAIMERALLHSDNSYYIPHMRVVGQVCKTNYHPHTAFRGFGGPKGMAMIESIIEDIAHTLNKDAVDVRRANVYRPGFDTTHYNQKVENNQLPGLFDKLIETSSYRKRRAEIERHNSKRTDGEALRGLSLTPVKFGISFTTRFLNQGNALVIMHRDGSIQVSTGAVEMGQGVHTRIASLVAEEFGIPVTHVHATTTSTDKNANTSPTAASSGTDLNGGAALVACRTLRLRLAALMHRLADTPAAEWASKTAPLGTAPEMEISLPIDEEALLSSVKFEEGRVFLKGKRGLSLALAELLREAYLNRISLTEYGFYKIPGLSFNKLTGRGQAFLYFSQGVCASEVLLNPWDGSVKVQRVDLLMDLGRPINHGLDMGQVTGAFIQGMGWVTTENLVYSRDGLLLTHSPSTYKIPSIQDTPRVFNVALIENNDNLANIRGTKASGEPPLMLALSVWTAIKDALRYARPGHLSNLSIPATAEIIMRQWQPEKFAKWDAAKGRQDR